MRMDGKNNRRDFTSLTITKLSSVAAPAHEDALSRIIKSKSPDQLMVSIAKQAPVNFADVMSDRMLRESAYEVEDDLWDLLFAFCDVMENILYQEVDNRQQLFEDALRDYADMVGVEVNNFRSNVEEVGKMTTLKGRTGFTPDDYAYAPDPESPSTWKFRLTRSPGGAPSSLAIKAAAKSLSAGDETGIPKDDLPAVIKRLRSAWLGSVSPAETVPDVLKTSNGDKDMSEAALQAQVDELRKELNRERRISAMTDTEKAHLNTLKGDDAEAYIALAPSDRVSAAKAAGADETLTVDGNVMRKSEMPAGVFETIKSQQAAIKAQADAIALGTAQQQVQDEYATLPGELAAKAQAVMTLKTMPEAERTTLEAMLAAGEAALKTQTKPQGHGAPGAEGESAGDKLTSMAKARAQKDGISQVEAYNLVSTENPDLYADAVNGK